MGSFFAVTGAVTAIAYGWSAAYGFSATADCRQQRVARGLPIEPRPTAKPDSPQP